MKTLALQHSSRLMVCACLMILLAVNLVIISSTTQNLPVHLQSTEAKERRAVKETICGWEYHVGAVWGFAAIQIPLWLSMTLFFIAADVAERRGIKKEANSFLWICCLMLVITGCLMFPMTRGEKFGVLGPSLWRYAPLILSALPAGILSSGVSREERWVTPLPTLLGFFIITLCIAGSSEFHV